MLAPGTQGARLAYVVVDLNETVGTVKRASHDVDQERMDSRRKMVEEPAGYMVYFPRGHVVRLRNKEELRQYRVDGPAPIINLQGSE